MTKESKGLIEEKIDWPPGREVDITYGYEPEVLLTWFELPQEEQEWFDYLTEAEKHDARFFRAGGEYSDVHEFLVAPECLQKRGWQGYFADSFFSGMFIRYNENDEIEYGFYFV